MTFTFADISKWQGTVNWGKYSLPAVALRSTVGQVADAKYAANVAAAHAKGLPVWHYHYKYNYTNFSATQAADLLINKSKFVAGDSYVLDDENESRVNFNYIKEFAARIKAKTGKGLIVYSNEARFNGVNTAALAKLGVKFWVASWGANNGKDNGVIPSANGVRAVAKQFTSTGSGTSHGAQSKALDLNTYYGTLSDFKSVTGGSSTPTPATPAKKTTDAIANEVIAGKWGTGTARKTALTKAGYDYNTIQAKVNALLATKKPAVKSAKTYTVKSGDNLSTIAAKYGTTWQTIYANNKAKIGANPNVIKVGTVLTIK